MGSSGPLGTTNTILPIYYLEFMCQQNQNHGPALLYPLCVLPRSRGITVYLKVPRPTLQAPWPHIIFAAQHSVHAS